MEEKEINYIELINENMKKYPNSCNNPIGKFMGVVINTFIYMNDIPNKDKTINELAKHLYEYLCELNYKWKYGDKEPGEVLVDLFSEALKGEDK